MLHRLQVTIDLHKSEKIVCKNKADIFQRHQFFRFKIEVDKR